MNTAERRNMQEARRIGHRRGAQRRRNKWRTLTVIVKELVVARQEQRRETKKLFQSKAMPRRVPHRCAAGARVQNSVCWRWTILGACRWKSVFGAFPVTKRWNVRLCDAVRLNQFVLLLREENFP